MSNPKMPNPLDANQKPEVDMSNLIKKGGDVNFGSLEPRRDEISMPMNNKISHIYTTSYITRFPTILVTGGTGSIGSEIVKQLADTEITIRVYSRDDTRQYMLQQELSEYKNIRYLIGDVRDRARLDRAMSGVDVVFHTAGLKHVPCCEYNPFEAVQTNVVGTQNVIQSAIDNGVGKVILISTDKAVNPINVMGITKRLAEQLMVAASEWAGNTKLLTARLGNVLGSRGSLAHIVKHQMETSRELYITDTRMTRFVITKRDAVEFIISIADDISAVSGEIYIPQMESVKITDLIEELAEYYNNKLHSRGSYGIKIVGIRKGEKLHEQLLSDNEIDYTTSDAIRFVIRKTKSDVMSEWRYQPDKALADKNYIKDLVERACNE